MSRIARSANPDVATMIPLRYHIHIVKFSQDLIWLIYSICLHRPIQFPVQIWFSLWSLKLFFSRVIPFTHLCAKSCRVSRDEREQSSLWATQYGLCGHHTDISVPIWCRVQMYLFSCICVRCGVFGLVWMAGFVVQKLLLHTPNCCRLTISYIIMIPTAYCGYETCSSWNEIR